ncbi:MAG: hypothetical protein V2I51_23700, partial [Anderseniella sp.]|nr:hypothetical protein [Anderseniella sp.]
MAERQFEATLAELARLHDDHDARRTVVERASLALLHRPALGGQLIARLCATDEDAPELETLADLLGSALDAARIAVENRKARGDAFLAAVTDAVELAAGQGRLTPFHRLLLASAWTRNGLRAPAALELTAVDMALADEAAALPSSADAEAMLEDLFRDLIAQAEGDALTL